MRYLKGILLLMVFEAVMAKKIPVYASEAEIFGIQEAEDDFALYDIEVMPASWCLNVPEILQLPELPTGCESVALTMVLSYEGFELEKTTIARDFLIYDEKSENMAECYIGDPFTEDGAGCFAPALAETAVAYLETSETDYGVYDISDSTLTELLSYVAAGAPVIVWSTMHMKEPEFTEDYGWHNGKTYRWYKQEHCVVLSGYDLEEKTLQINDPLEGIVERDMEEFERLYDLTGRQAIVLRAEETEKWCNFF